MQMHTSGVMIVLRVKVYTFCNTYIQISGIHILPKLIKFNSGKVYIPYRYVHMHTMSILFQRQTVYRSVGLNFWVGGLRFLVVYAYFACVNLLVILWFSICLLCKQSCSQGNCLCCVTGSPDASWAEGISIITHYFNFLCRLMQCFWLLHTYM